MKSLYVLLYLQSFFAYREAFGFDLSSLIPLCNAKDPNLNECVKSAGQKLVPIIAKGVDELNIPSMDPLKTAELSFTDKNGNNNLVITYRNVVQTGFSGLSIENVDVDLQHGVMTFKLKFPHITFEADYEAKGRFFNFDLDGNGKANISVWNALSSLVIKYHVISDHIKQDSIIFGFSFDKIFLDYTNLMVNNDEELSKSAGIFINENSAEIIDSFKPELEKYYAKITSVFIQGLFDYVPYSGLFKKS